MLLVDMEKAGLSLFLEYFHTVIMKATLFCSILHIINMLFSDVLVQV